MARKTSAQNKHEFTRQIHSTVRRGTEFAGMKNWNEERAKCENKICCKDCRHYDIGCGAFIGAYHKPCEKFKWW